MARIPGHREGRKRHGRGGDESDRQKRQRVTRRLRGKGDDDRNADQRGKGIAKAPGYEKQRRQLQKVNGQQQEGRAGRKALCFRVAQRHEQVEGRKAADEHGNRHDRQRELQQQGHRRHGRRLPRNRQPAKTRQCVQSEVSAVMTECHIGVARCSVHVYVSGLGGLPFWESSLVPKLAVEFKQKWHFGVARPQTALCAARLGPVRGRGVRGIFRPGVLRVAPAHVGPHILPRSRPEARQIARCLDRSVRR